uniref:alpha/beta hydrolase n=1 Tax=Actinomyces oris TaxID=544580 RepID=UPI0028D56868
MTSLARIIAGPDDAPTLVLLHGITGSAVSLAEAIDHWVGRGYRVVAADARGHGLSPRWEPAQLERAGEVLVEDLIAVLEELEAASRGRAALGLPTPPAPVVIGHSMGAATAMVAAVRRPDLLCGVVLEDPARFGTRSPRELLARGAARERARAAEVADLPAAVGRALETMPDAEALPGVWASPRTDPGL